MIDGVNIIFQNFSPRNGGCCIIVLTAGIEIAIWLPVVDPVNASHVVEQLKTGICFQPVDLGFG